MSMANRYGRQARLSFLLVGELLVGPFTSTVDAQPGGRRNRVELLAGVGNAWAPSCWVDATAMIVCDAYSLEAYEIGVAFWWSAHWGFAWRQEFNPREYSIDPPPSVFNEDPSRQKNMRGHSLTVRYRGFGTGGMEYDFGAGVETVKYDRASFREGANQRSFRSVGNSGLVFELLVGRKLSQRIGVKAGVSHAAFLYEEGLDRWRTKVVGFAVIGF